jgi:hypothetical protein
LHQEADATYYCTAAASSNEDDLESLLQDNLCAICTHLLLVYDELPCHHRFCHECTKDWFTRRQTTCPHCAVEVDFNFHYRPPELDDARPHDAIIERLARSARLTDEEKAERAAKLVALDKKRTREKRREKQLKDHMDAARVEQKVNEHAEATIDICVDSPPA